jgi:hypothetical protein
MPQPKLKRFAGAERYEFLGPDQEPPASGVAVRAGDGAVFENGKQIGTWHAGVVGDPSDRQV